MSGKVVVLLSGGLDSSTLLYYVKRVFHYGEIYTLSINYGQRHVCEITAAYDVAKSLLVPWTKINIDLSAFKGSALTDSTLSTREEKDLPVPARNAIFLSIAAAYAKVVGATVVFFAPTEEDYETFPDCRPEFVEAMEKALSLSGEINTISAPFITWTKKEILLQGLELGVPYESTHTCYEGAPSCGRCNACVKRLKAFEEVGVKDPIEYKRRVEK